MNNWKLVDTMRDRTFLIAVEEKALTEEEWAVVSELINSLGLKNCREFTIEANRTIITERIVGNYA